MDFNIREFESIKEATLERKSEREKTESDLSSLKESKDRAEEYLLCAKEAQSILQSVARETQSEIEDHISEIVSLSLSAVEVPEPDIPPPPEFIARMVERRDSTECDLLFKEGNREQSPLECSGFGYVDIADYALRVCYILLKNEYGAEKVRKTIISDEPFRNADVRLQYKISEMLRMISDKLGFQQIIVSHADGVNTSADKTFSTTKHLGLSKVTS